MKVHLSDLAFQYRTGSFQLHVPELEIPAGEHVAFVGRSGCGKTTLLQLIAGTLLPLRGSVRIDERDLTKLKDAQRRALRITRMGLVFQELELLEHLDLRENLLLPYFINPALSLDREVERRARMYIEKLGLGEHLARHPKGLSQGERQRVAVARALITQPHLLLADEPTGNLDPATRRVVLDLVLQDARERNATLCFVTHDHELLEGFDRVIDVSAWANSPHPLEEAAP